MMKHKIVNPDALEQLLVQNWTRIFDYRQIISIISNKIGEKPNKITLSRFELTTSGTLVWFEYSSQAKSGTLEILLSSIYTNSISVTQY